MRNPFGHRLVPLIAGAILGAVVVGGGAVVLAGESTPPYERESTATLHPGPGARHGLKFGLAQIIEASGLDRSVFREGFAGGKSINTILQENGLDPAEIEAEVLAAIRAHLDEKVVAGDLTEEQADALFERASNALPGLMAAEPGDRPGHHHHPILAGIRQVVAASGLDFEVFREGFAAGKSINTILVENGLDPAEVQAEVLATLQAHLDEKVAAGDLTQEQADPMYERASNALAGLMDATPPAGGEARGPRPGAVIGGALQIAADAIGIDTAALAESLRGGSSIAQVAEANGVDPQAVVDAIVAEATARIDQGVADGKIDSTRAEQMKANLEERVTNMVNGTFKMRGPGGRHFQGGWGEAGMGPVAGSLLRPSEVH